MGNIWFPFGNEGLYGQHIPLIYIRHDHNQVSRLFQIQDSSHFVYKGIHVHMDYTNLRIFMSVLVNKYLRLLVRKLYG